MAPLNYLRPKTIEEAIDHLQSGVVLAGGTGLTPRRAQIDSVVDISDLGLDKIEREDQVFHIGAGTSLQAILTNAEIPAALRQACTLEAGWNMRNMSTLGGTIMDADGRSALVTILLALSAEIVREPEGDLITIDRFLSQRTKINLITQIQFEKPRKLLYEQVARTPLDFPIVCASLAVADDKSGTTNVALGGHGARPVRLPDAEDLVSKGTDRYEVERAARRAYKDASDHWASAEYRSAIAGILVRRLMEEGTQE